MLIYEVNLEVNDDVAKDFFAWLPEHIREILEIDGVVGAKFFNTELAEAKPDKRYATVQYEMRDRKAYENYIQNHAPRLRENVMKRFSGRFTATRRVLIPKIYL